MEMARIKSCRFHFISRENVLQIAEELLGKLLVTNKDQCYYLRPYS